MFEIVHPADSDLLSHFKDSQEIYSLMCTDV